MITSDRILNKIRADYLRQAAPIALAFVVIMFVCVRSLIERADTYSFWPMMSVVLLLAVVFIGGFIALGYKVFAPEKSMLFKRFGGVEHAVIAIQEAYNMPKNYENSRLVITNKYIYSKQYVDIFFLNDDIVHLDSRVVRTSISGVNKYMITLYDRLGTNENITLFCKTGELNDLLYQIRKVCRHLDRAGFESENQ